MVALPWLAGALVVSPVAYYSVMAVYNIYFHPLSKYPGPKSWSATPFHYAILQLRGTCPKDTAKMHQKYGPVLRISANELSFTYPGAWRDIFGHKGSGQPEFKKDERFHAATNKEQNIISSDREYHTYLRKLLANGFSDSALRQQEGLIQGYLDTLMSRLNEKGNAGGSAVDLALWFNYFTFDVIGYLTYGESFDCLNFSALNAWVSSFFAFVIYTANCQAAARLPSFVRRPLVSLVTPRDRKQQFALSEGILDQKVKARLQNKPPVPDFMEKLIDAYRKKAMSFYQLKTNSQLLIGAGSETTATALSGIVYLLAMHPEQYAKVTTEIRTQFASAEEITMVSVNKCRYLFAVIEEGLRMYPPSSTAHSRYVPPGGATLDGNFVPEGMLVGITTYAIMHAKENWVNPDKFAPERWLPEGERPEEYNADKKDSFQAFSYGPRNCIGRNLAYAEMKIVLARLLWEFDVEYCGPKGDDWLDQPIYVVWQKKPLMVKLHPRNKA
ncbi:averantin oxidoreductase [Microdochium bolleyi]|uniref:Averantin oxidoreductase n=1 Tax=Microdochium bolleyi TaxID=196109 RepID=A0A136ITD9_9PEZI|nr:averantin oxidoreductase [Microdochium bolleyi]